MVMMMTSSLAGIEELVEWTGTAEEFSEHLVRITEHKTWEAAAEDEFWLEWIVSSSLVMAAVTVVVVS